MSTQNNTPTKSIFDNLSDVSDDEITHYRVFDATWSYDTKHDHFSDEWNNHEDFDTLEEAMEEYHRRCEEYYADEENENEVDAVYLEEMGGGEDADGGGYQIDTLEYWSRMTIAEFEAKEKKKAQKKKKHKKKPPLKVDN